MGKVVAWASHTLDATTAQPCNDFASLHANPYSDSTKVVASLRSKGEHDLATMPSRLSTEHCEFSRYHKVLAAFLCGSGCSMAARMSSLWIMLRPAVVTPSMY